MTYFNDIYIKTIAFSLNKDRQLLDYKTKYLHPLNMIISLFLTEIVCNPYISIKTDKNLIYTIQFCLLIGGNFQHPKKTRYL